MFFKKALTSIEQTIGLSPSRIDDHLIAFDLLADATDGGPLCEAIIDRISATMPVGDNGLRMTYPNRFKEVDERMIDLIRSRFNESEEIRIHDLAVSNASTSLALFERMRIAMPNAVITASDLLTRISVVEVPGSWWRVVFDESGNWIQAISRTCLIYPRKIRSVGSIHSNAIIRALVERCIVPRARRALDEGVHTRSISLFHPRAQEMARSDDRFRLRCADLLELPRGAWEIVRVMTVLFNWSGDLRDRALESVAGAVADHGLLVIGQGGHNFKLRCSIFQRSGTRMLHLMDVGVTPAREKESIMSLTISS